MIDCFCFPYAGGSARVYQGWNARLPDAIRIIPVELPGRGRRFQEPLARSVSELIERLGPDLLPELRQPYAFFGHSLGSLIAFELCHWLLQRGGPEPAHFFVSGRRAPQRSRATVSGRNRPVSELDDRQLVEELRALNGTPAEVLANAELLELFLPIIRVDFGLDDGYIYQPRTVLTCPLTVLGGTEDLTEVSREALYDWRVHSSGPFNAHLLPGDHFFLFSDAQAEVLRILQSSLMSASG